MTLEVYPALLNLETHTETSLKGRIFTFGSSQSCGLVLPRECPERLGHFLFSNGRYQIQSLNSGSVRFNGKPVQAPMEMRHGDEIDLAGRVFRFLERADAPESGPDEDPVGEFIEIMVGLLQERRPDGFDRLVGSVSRILKCDAARLVGEDPVREERVTLARYPRESGLERFSNRAIDWARDAEKTVLMHQADWNDEADEGGSASSLTSLEKNRVSSILCAPLAEQGQVLGYLYLDRLNRDMPFTEKDRRFCDLLRPLFEEILRQRKEWARQKETIARLQQAGGAGGSVIYGSRNMIEVMELAGRVAATDSTVLINGETGTGKEVLARFIHAQSRRADKPFLAINCGAIPENLIESELFGYEKGSFTGATQQKKGLFESAQGGTVFLDEIGELTLSLQVKLLRVLQEGCITRVGGNEPLAVNVRILSATHRDLTREVEEGRFRQDMYFRLNVLQLNLPALRERDDDILLLADYLLKKYCQQFGLPLKQLSASARKELMLYAWPGNIRELENVMQKAILLSTSRLLGASDLPLRQSPFARKSPVTPGFLTLKEARAAAEKDAITAAMQRCRGNISQASRLLQIDRKWLMKMMQELEIDADAFRE